MGLGGRWAAGGRQEGVGEGFGVELEGEGDPGEGYGCQQQRQGVKRIRGGVRNGWLGHEALKWGGKTEYGNRSARKNQVETQTGGEKEKVTGMQKNEDTISLAG